MLKGFQSNLYLWAWPVLLWAVLEAVAVAKENGDFPARYIVNSIMKAEAAIERAYTLKIQGPATELRIPWVPMALPHSSRSWMYLNIPSQALEKLQNNLDSQGRPVF